MFIHHVYFWVKADAAAVARERLREDCRALLAKIPGVVHLWAGGPVKSDREVVDSTYSVGLAVIFADQAGHDAYQVHPLHLEFIARNKADWERIRVYDFEG